ncbi:hypothetical protein [Catenulispora pinisilvae]|uniref:hypothetical protein n=1 Tax=Catenulispora pinisilvae TaxID=2705253 RepID=UPI001891CF52|nr:hypothetical protein [Catenulispora pinisilvae]
MLLMALAEIFDHGSITTTSRYCARLMPGALDYARETVNAEPTDFMIFPPDPTGMEQKAA